MANKFGCAWKPENQIRVKYTQIHEGSDADALTFMSQIQALRVANADYDLKVAVPITGITPLAQATLGWKLCLTFKTPTGYTVTICFEHTKQSVDVGALATLCMAHCTAPNGDALTSLVDSHYISQLYV